MIGRTLPCKWTVQCLVTMAFNPCLGSSLWTLLVGCRILLPKACSSKNPSPVRAQNSQHRRGESYTLMCIYTYCQLLVLRDIVTSQTVLGELPLHPPSAPQCVCCLNTVADMLSPSSIVSPSSPQSGAVWILHKHMQNMEGFNHSAS